MVEALTTGGDGIDVVVAAAGAGKTFALAAAVDAWQTAGRIVHGAALSARAAAELEASTGVASTTLARLTMDLQSVGPGDVVILDLCRARNYADEPWVGLVGWGFSG